MTTTSKQAVIAGIASISITLAVAGSASAGPPMKPGGVNAPSAAEIAPGAKNGPAGRARLKGGKRFVAGPDSKPAIGVIAPVPDHSHGLTPKPKSPVMADLRPGELLHMSVAGGTEVADGIIAGVSARGGDYTSGNLFGADLQMRKHDSAGSPDNTVQLVLLPENLTQTYDFELDVTNGNYNVSVDAYWVNDTSEGGPARDRDELLAVGKQRTVDGKLYITLMPDPRWKPGASVAYYVVVSRDTDWVFRGASIARAS